MNMNTMLAAIEQALMSAASQLTVAGLVVQLVSVFLMWTTIRVSNPEVRELAIGGFWEADYQIFGARRATARAAIYKQHVAFSGLTTLLLGVVIQLAGVALAQLKHPGFPLWVFFTAVLLSGLAVYLAARRLSDSLYRNRIEGAIQVCFDQWLQEGVRFKPSDVSDVSAEIRALLADVRCEEQIQRLIDTQMKRVTPPDGPA